MKAVSKFALPTLLIGLAGVLAACGGEGNQQPVPSDPQQAAGLSLIQRNCIGCHSLDGSSRSGPTFQGLAGSQVQLEDGRTVTADDAYLERAIREPDAEIVDGYSKGVMSSSMRRLNLTDEQIAQMVAYINSLGTGER